MPGAATRAIYPLTGGLAAARLLGALGTHRSGDELAGVLSTQPAATWSDNLPRSCAATRSGAMIRLAVTFGAVLGTGGETRILTGGRFDRAGELAGVNIAALEPPTVGWLLRHENDGGHLGFHTGAAGACAGLAALGISRHHTLTRGASQATLQQVDGEPVDPDAAYAASVHAPTSWVAAAELFGAIAALGTWAPTPLSTVEPGALLAALYGDARISEGPADATGQAAWWDVDGALRYRREQTVTDNRTRIAWVEEPLAPRH